MNPIYAETGVDWVGVVVSRREVESLDIGPALDTLQSLLYDAETVRMFQGQACIAFHGYDEDPRQLYQISEIRQYFAELDSKFPYWFYFLSTNDDTLKLVALCLCRTTGIGASVAYPDPNDMQAFMISHFSAINRLFGLFQLDEAISEEISGLVADYFFPRQT